MRILHIVGTMNPEAGGPTEVIRVLASYAPPGYASEVVTFDAPGAPFLRDLPFPVHALGPVDTIFGRNPRLKPWLKANRDRYDGVIVHGLWVYIGYAVWRTMRGRVPYLVFPHGMLDPYFKRTFPLKHLKKWVYWLAAEYWVLRGADRVLFTSDAEAELARESFWLHHWNAYVTPFGTVPPGGDPASQLQAFYQRCPKLRDRRLLLFLGRVHPKKGADLLIDAFVNIASRQPDLDLVIAGPDSNHLRDELMHGAEVAEVVDRIHWVGMLRGEAKWGAFYAAEAFCLTSHQENFGIAVAEALACGVPVLLSDKVNIAAEIARDSAGLMESDTAAGTERLLERWILLRADERRAMAVRARETFQRRYDMRENAKTIVRLFEKNAVV